MRDLANPRPMDADMSLDNVVDLAGIFARREAAAKEVLATFEVRRAVRYGPGPGETLNVFPAGPGAPVMVFIHGGFWKSLDADLFSYLAPGFVPMGATLVNIDYPLMPSVRLADIVASCERALAFVHENAASFGADPARMFISGNSAGGHLVAEMMARPVGKLVAGGTAISGVYDLEPVTRSFQNDELQLTAEEISQLSPLRRALTIDAPLIVAVGGDETPEFLRQSHAFAAQCGVPTMVVPHTNHITILTDALALPHHPFNQAVRRQMGLAVD